jgi:hypothetical protein
LFVLNLFPGFNSRFIALKSWNVALKSFDDGWARKPELSDAVPGEPVRDPEGTMSDISKTGDLTVRDVSRQRNIGRFTGNFKSRVAAHDVVFVRIVNRENICSIGAVSELASIIPTLAQSENSHPCILARLPETARWKKVRVVGSRGRRSIEQKFPSVHLH